MHVAMETETETNDAFKLPSKGCNRGYDAQAVADMALQYIMVEMREDDGVASEQICEELRVEPSNGSRSNASKGFPNVDQEVDVDLDADVSVDVDVDVSVDAGIKYTVDYVVDVVQEETQTVDDDTVEDELSNDEEEDEDGDMVDDIDTDHSESNKHANPISRKKKKQTTKKTKRRKKTKKIDNVKDEFISRFEYLVLKDTDSISELGSLKLIDAGFFSWTDSGCCSPRNEPSNDNSIEMREDYDFSSKRGKGRRDEDRIELRDEVDGKELSTDRVKDANSDIEQCVVSRVEDAEDDIMNDYESSICCGAIKTSDSSLIQYLVESKDDDDDSAYAGGEYENHDSAKVKDGDNAGGEGIFPEKIDADVEKENEVSQEMKESRRAATPDAATDRVVNAVNKEGKKGGMKDCEIGSTRATIQTVTPVSQEEIRRGIKKVADDEMKTPYGCEITNDDNSFSKSKGPIAPTRPPTLDYVLGQVTDRKLEIEKKVHWSESTLRSCETDFSENVDNGGFVSSIKEATRPFLAHFRNEISDGLVIPNMIPGIISWAQSWYEPLQAQRQSQSSSGKDDDRVSMEEKLKLMWSLHEDSCREKDELKRWIVDLERKMKHQEMAMAELKSENENLLKQCHKMEKRRESSRHRTIRLEESVNVSVSRESNGDLAMPQHLNHTKEIKAENLTTCSRGSIQEPLRYELNDETMESLD